MEEHMARDVVERQAEIAKGTHLGDGLPLSGLRRAISQVSMLVVKATSSGEAAWREECIKYASSQTITENLLLLVIYITKKAKRKRNDKTLHLFLLQDFLVQVCSTKISKVE